MRPVIPYVVAAALFGIGAFGVLRRRHAILLLMAVELMLNAVNLILVTAATTVRAALAAVGTPYTGHVFALFVIVIAAAELGVGLAIVLQLFRLRASVAVDTVPLSEPAEVEVADGVPGTVDGDGVPAVPGRVASGEAVA
ncbi:MAG TPA: NADH-quinone oxidoreductase subunit NuoK [Natronosporangium sp.]|nr:NADH-quinone oxidoreductase subunit NuoK [Natronosporangium sp.]